MHQRDQLSLKWLEKRNNKFLANKTTTNSTTSNIFSDQGDERKFPGCNLTIFPICNVSIMNS